jgi:YD repeat-containing protein
VSGSDYRFAYTYDATGRRLAEKFPDDTTVSQTYDTDGRTKTLATSGGFVTTYAYDAESRLDTISNSHGRSVAYTYYPSAGVSGDDANRLKEIITSGGAVTTYDYWQHRLRRYKVDPTSGSDYVGFYVYNTDGTIQSIYDQWSPSWGSETGFRWRYYYDGAGHLTGETRQEMSGGSLVDTPLDQDYTYDAAGNRLSRTGSGTGYELMDDVSGHHDVQRHAPARALPDGGDDAPQPLVRRQRQHDAPLGQRWLGGVRLDVHLERRQPDDAGPRHCRRHEDPLHLRLAGAAFGTRG